MFFFCNWDVFKLRTDRNNEFSSVINGIVQMHGESIIQMLNKEELLAKKAKGPRAFV
jgi:hypothetical protein